MSAADSRDDPLCSVCGHPIVCVAPCCATDDDGVALAHNGCSAEGREVRADLDAAAAVADAIDTSAEAPR